MGVGDALDDLGDVVFLFGNGDAVLVHDQMTGFRQGGVNDLFNLVVLEGVVDHFFATRVTVVRGCGVACVHRVQFSLDVRGQIVDPVYPLDVWVREAGEGGFFDDPFEKGFDLDVEAGIGGLVGDDAVNGAVGETHAGGEVREAGGLGVFFFADEVCQGGSGADGVFAGDYGEGGVDGTDVDSFGDDGGDEAEDVGADGAGYLFDGEI